MPLPPPRHQCYRPRLPAAGVTTTVTTTAQPAASDAGVAKPAAEMRSAWWDIKESEYLGE